MKTALIADWLPTFGGAEHVLASIRKLFPDAPIFTTVAKKEKLGPLATADIRTSSLQKWYRLLGRHQYLLPWMPRTIENINLSSFDLILSSSHAVGKGIIPPSHAVHVCYCHTPMRYAWEMEGEYLKDFKLRGPLKWFAQSQLKKLRRWDLSNSKRVDVFIANSKETQSRIKKLYNRDSVVIQPPVDDRFFVQDLSSVPKENHFLAIGRFVPYKRFDLLIETANALGFPLKIIGRGDDEKRLRKLAGPTVEFLGFIPDEELPRQYMAARAVLFPQFEDAGVVPLEAQASGTPVIAFAKGGALETVIDQKTGLFFAAQTQDALKDALVRFDKSSFDPAVIREHAQQFSEARFLEQTKKTIDDALHTFGR